jgi:hypothetical protein
LIFEHDAKFKDEVDFDKGIHGSFKKGADGVNFGLNFEQGRECLVELNFDKDIDSSVSVGGVSTIMSGLGEKAHFGDGPRPPERVHANGLKEKFGADWQPGCHRQVLPRSGNATQPTQKKDANTWHHRPPRNRWADLADSDRDIEEL